MSSVRSQVDLFAERGFLSKEEKQALIDLVQEDGIVDDEESQQLSRLFSLIDAGKVRLLSVEQIKNLKQQEEQTAVLREKELKRLRSQQAKEERRKAELWAVVQSWLKAGVVSEEAHESFLADLHRDGTIDYEEQSILSELHSYIQSGRLTILASDGGALKSSGMDARASKARDYFCECGENEQESVSQFLPRNGVQDDYVQQGAAESTSQSAFVRNQVEAGEDDTSYTFANFIHAERRVKSGGRAFELETDRFLNISLKSQVWLKTGSMVAYQGHIKFEREGFLDHGAKKLLKKSFTGEGMNLSKAVGQGTLYLADEGKKISVIELKGDSLIVKGGSLLAFEQQIDWDIIPLRSAGSLLAGGLFNVRLAGGGLAAISSHDDPIVLLVKPNEPVYTDPCATVAWSGSLTPNLKTDVNIKTLIGRSSGETLQLEFVGDGFVVIQPFEDSIFKDSNIGKL